VLAEPEIRIASITRSEATAANSTTLPSHTSIPWTETSAACSTSAVNPIVAHSRVAPTPAAIAPSATHAVPASRRPVGRAIDVISEAIAASFHAHRTPGSTAVSMA
jgi:hypothetical protein